MTRDKLAAANYFTDQIVVEEGYLKEDLDACL